MNKREIQRHMMQVLDEHRIELYADGTMPLLPDGWERIEIPFREDPYNEDDPTKRPYLKVRIRHRKGGPEYTFWGLLDTGADSVLLSWEIAQKIGIKKGDCKRIPHETAYGKFVMYSCSVEIKIGSSWYPCRVCFRVDGLQAPVLGRRDFFRYFVLIFKEQLNCCTLEIPPNAARTAAHYLG